MPKPHVSIVKYMLKIMERKGIQRAEYLYFNFYNFYKSPR